MKQLITTLILLLTAQAFAQPNEIDKTCSEYDDNIKMAEDEEMPSIVPHITVESELIEKAIGPVKHTLTVYFDEEEREFVSNGTSESTWENVETRRKLIFRESSVSYDITHTYYYDKEGDLIKYIKDEKGYECSIVTYYFEGEKVLKISSKPQESEDCHNEDQAETFERTEITEDDQRMGYAVLYNSNQLAGVLRETYDAFKD